MQLFDWNAIKQYIKQTLSVPLGPSIAVKSISGSFCVGVGLENELEITLEKTVTRDIAT